jgi:putative phosphoesterase
LVNPLLTVGVIADTHIPDRSRALHPRIIPLLQEMQVDLILHAGDISSPGVLEILEKVAPVKAVRGNRDWVFLTTLPLTLKLTLANVPLVLMHGHNGLVNYVRDKFLYIRDGYKFERYQKKLVKLAPEARVIVFGHTHRVVNKVIDGQLWFNPGSAGFSFREDALPTIGVLRFYDKGKVRGEVLKLDGFRLQKGLWEAVSSS